MALAKEDSVRMTTTPEMVERTAIHYIFVEKTGAFQQEAPAAWQELHPRLAEIRKANQVIERVSLYKVGPQIYRAGVTVASKPAEVPAGLRYEYVPGGKYARFVLSGSYSQLPEACGLAFTLVRERRLTLRDDFNLENYVTDPRNTPEEELVTELLFPVA